jgi:ATP-dependent protease ClpP protease subunit
MSGNQRDARNANRFWGGSPLPKSKTEFFNAVTTPAQSGTGTVATIRMYGPIDSWGGFWGVSANDMGKVLDALPDSVTRIILRVNSPGGEVFEGVSILNMLRAHKATVTAVVDGLAASAASVIVAGADDTVMSPGTQMMIHSPSNFAYGNAVELRKTADVLDGLESSLIEIYAAKAGDKDWVSLLADETWMSATEAVEVGLADRIAVIPDAGETETVGDDDEQIISIPDEEIGDSAADRVVRISAHAPVAPEVQIVRHRGDTGPTSTSFPLPRDQKLPDNPDAAHNNTHTEGVEHMPDITSRIRERLGFDAEAELDEDGVLAAIDRLAAPKNTLPEGTRVIDEAKYADLVAAAEEGRQARAQQIEDRRTRIVDQAIDDGKLAPARRDHWLALMASDEEGTTDILNKLEVGATFPVKAKGTAGGVDAAGDDDDDTFYAKLFNSEKKEA